MQLNIRYIIATILLSFLMMSNGLLAQKNSSGKLDAKADEQEFYTKYVILATDATEFQYALEVAEKLKPKKTGYQYEVLISGILAEELYTKRKELKNDIKQFKKLGAHLVLCEIAIRDTDVDKKKIHRSVEVIPDTFPYLLELKKDGFHVLSHKK